MDPNDQATAHVHDALAGLRERASGPLPRASRASLERLIEAAKTSPAAVIPSPRPQAAVAEATQTVAPRGLAARALAAMQSSSPTISASAPAVQEKQATPAAPAVVVSGSKAERLEQLRAQILPCENCPQLVASRSHVVFGVGNPEAELMFVGEAPGADEDLQGEPFVGKAGQLLTKIIEAMGLARSDVYIANVLKCRPDMPEGESGNRKPRADEMATCLPHLIAQIDIIKPKCLVALGATAMEGLLGEAVVMRDVRGRWHNFKGIPLMATYHPAYLLRNQSLTEKRKVWEDMLQVMEKLGEPISAKQRGFFLPK